MSNTIRPFGHVALCLNINFYVHNQDTKSQRRAKAFMDWVPFPPHDVGIKDIVHEAS